jgi:hypothetical protein
LLRRIPSLVAALYLTVARVQAAGLRLIGLVVIGGNPDFRARLAYMRLPETTTRKCEQIRDNKAPAEPLVHDPRIKAAAIVDSIFAVLFSRDGLKGVTIPVQLWRSALGGDGIVPEAVAALEGRFSARPDYRVIANSSHFSFVAPWAGEGLLGILFRSTELRPDELSQGI